MRIILIFLMALAIYVFQERVYLKRCFQKLYTTMKFNKQSVFEGEELELSVEITNRKFTPLWWLCLKFYISRYIHFLEDGDNAGSQDNFRKDLFFIMSFEKVTRKYKVVAAKRGFYEIKDFELSSGDFFSKYRIMTSEDCNISLYVYPKLINIDIINIVFNKLNGEVVSKRHYIEDPFYLRGIRDYYMFDSMKKINWNATARTGQLKVNEFDYTSSGRLKIILDMEKYNVWDSSQIIEDSIRLAASFSSKYIEEGMNVEFVTNGQDILSKEYANIDSGNNINHLFNIYEALARIDENACCKDINEIFEHEFINSNKDKVYIFISHYYSKDLKAVVEMYRNIGFDIKWVFVKLKSDVIELDEHNDFHIWEAVA
ncbi:DUF58 domain-containing protein [Clostridium oryzae]|uniref:Uncharacterized protein n=1 Tax=Clostridium oryzae TaxID=1450648 RepID=A0A1V4IJM7_9CLOT|nr:DUF58 domain-containing protein [Clostridium oryzae]OPJ60109.1 hypothetical protein CLORY_29720 [Clostridium oryzae]